MVSKKTKIVCTIGPSSWDKEIMKKMIDNGMNVARVNGAFADEAEIDKVTNLVRSFSQDVALMIDVKGPEVRLNKFDTPLDIKPMDIVTIGNDDTSKMYPANYKDLYQKVNIGQRILIGDGDVELVIRDIRDEKMICEVVYGEKLKPGKSLNLPDADIATQVLTEKDIVNLKYAISKNWDFVSASFMQTAEAAREVKKYLEGSHMKLIAKIEDQTGVDNIDEILEEVEGVMIARGGLGIELGLERVPMVQKYLIEKCNALGKPVITATQMLESMTYNPRPTRAEVNDVAFAVMMGSDAVMLSGESSAGQYPVEAVKELSTIAIEIEKYIDPKMMYNKIDYSPSADALSRAAAEMCIRLGEDIDIVIVASKSGYTSKLLGRHRIKQPIYSFVANDFYARRLNVSKGVTKAFSYLKVFSDRDLAVRELLNEAKRLGIVKVNQRVLIVGKGPKDETQYFPNIFEVIKVN